MGASGISIWQLLIILVIVMLLFGTKRLKNIGADLGDAIKGFRNSMAERDRAEETSAETDSRQRIGAEAVPPRPDATRAATGQPSERPPV